LPVNDCMGVVTNPAPVTVVSQFYSNEFRQRRAWPFRYVTDDEVIVRGNYQLACLVTPGHAIGHSCLYESG
jgi:glyoxylase-like metal-dependent hydrolase (beta-lactamase superfamily II)